MLIVHTRFGVNKRYTEMSIFTRQEVEFLIAVCKDNKSEVATGLLIGFQDLLEELLKWGK